ncbi:discoidin domain-containing protein [Streptomyces sp. 8L]|uniref:discoidin domain-containing protein n=1 Tax=Streptomyces sp. 8L TaxID=2877242 RepID=UPI001CD7E200|nr:discoidin domain-containing protein [Streptomyces sp. 8L]MCA1219774.1 zinc ribbon domain-containing protein [Streptomyces sp. 8L]
MTPSQAPGGQEDDGRSLACDQCGTPQDPGQTFCDTCNAVLRWSASPAKPAPAPPAQSGPAPSSPAHADPVASGPIPSDRAQSGPMPSGPMPSGPMPSGPAYSQPMPSSSAPSGPMPTGPMPSGSPAYGSASVPMPLPDEQQSAYPRDTRASWAASQRPATPPAYDAAPAYGSTPAQDFDPGYAAHGQGAAQDFDPGYDPEATATEPLPRADGHPAQDHSGGEQPWQGGESAADRARALLVPVDDPQAQQERSQYVAPVLPGRPEPVRPGVRAPGEAQIQGGILCPWCSTPNMPERHFCSRCAMRMAGGEDEAIRSSWWRRMFDRDNREQPWAGDRPRLRRQLGRIFRWVAMAAVAALVVTGLFHVPQGWRAARDHFSKRASIAPDSYRASHSWPHHGASLVFDKLSNTYWAPGYSEAGTGEWVEADFSQPVDILNVGITSGQSAHAETLSKSALPHRIDARVTMDNGKVVTKQIILDQVAGFQERSLQVHDVTSVRFILNTAYGISSKKQVAIAEIELFGPSQGGS